MSIHTKNIIHKGIVIQSKGKSHSIQLIDETNCESCSLKSSCGLSNNPKTLHALSNKHFDKGSEVLVLMKRQKGFVAVLIAYVIPFLIMMSSLLLLSQFLSEPKVAFVSIFLTGLYYGGLFLYKNRLKAYFQFDILKT